MKTCRRLARLACLLLMLLALPAAAQDLGGGRGQRIEGDVKFLPIPYLNYDRSVGFQIGGLPMAMFNPVKNDTISPSSIAGLFGMYTSNETWAVMGFGRTHLDEDNWRVALAGGTGSINFQFYLDQVSAWIPYNTGMDFLFTQLQRRVYRRFYAGLSYVYLDFETTFEPVPEETVRSTAQGLGLNLELDARLSVFYPRTGFRITGRYSSYPGGVNDDVNGDKIEVDYNHYFSLRRDADVVAARAFVGIGIGDLDFNQQFIVGRRSDIRGYTQGEFRGGSMLAVQGEYRWNFARRLGAVGFLGVATVFDTVNADHEGKLLPGVGVGIRYAMDTDTNMNVGLDVAKGDSDWGIYFRLGEAF